MRYVLVVEAMPQVDAAAASALRFARALLAAGEQLELVWFTGNGSLAAAPRRRLAGTEPDQVAAWTALAQQHGFRLRACATEAGRRGIGVEVPAPGEAFAVVQLSGLGSLIEAMARADRLLRFPS